MTTVNTTPTPTAAQIITHARFDRAPVVQTPRRGRLPNSVIKFWQAGGDIRIARRKEQEWQEQVNLRVKKLIELIGDHEEIALMYRGELAGLRLACAPKGAVNV